MARGALDDLPGFRRRITITPEPGCVRAEVEDDFHHMVVTVRHANGIAEQVEGVMLRAPWSTCSGAPAVLTRTFTGMALADFATNRAAKPSNCTHLFDLAQWAAAHANDDAPTFYEVLTADPVNGETETELRRDGAPVLRWSLAGFTISAPAELAGVSLWKLNDWIATLTPPEQEAARLLRWASIMSFGRSIPLKEQSEAKQMMSGACFTFQPENAVNSIRVGELRDLSGHGIHPLMRDSEIPRRD